MILWFKDREVQPDYLVKILTPPLSSCENSALASVLLLVKWAQYSNTTRKIAVSIK